MKRSRLSATVSAGQVRHLDAYIRSLRQLVKDVKCESVLDLGCGPGLYTLEIEDQVRPMFTVGVDIDIETMRSARARGVEVVRADLNRPLPFPDDSFDFVLTSQVIEHVDDCDAYLREIRRVLKTGGHSLIATENLAAWHNILSLVFGYQPFTENISKVRRIGNPFMSNYGETPRFDNLHNKVFTLVSLVELAKLHEFQVVGARCTGYPPFPAAVSPLLCRIDGRHSRYIAILARK